ncbi:putative membrane copper amine oxidase [Wilcoxina mikolae CBS 423.85]|nr:putative membrane copper amine oxidase [Wilcoxina mikolae CBS 423.85]
MKLFLHLLLLCLSFASISSAESICTSCVPTNTTATTAPYTNIWLGLTDSEVSSVATFLSAHGGFNISQNSTTGGIIGTDTLLLIELLHPNKTDALTYISHPSSPSPPRYAHAIVHVGTVLPPYIQDLRIGPLPISPSTTVEELNYPYNRGGRTNNTWASLLSATGWIQEVATNLSDITTTLWGKSVANASLTLRDSTPPVTDEEGRVVSWVQFKGVPEGEWDSSTLLPLGLYLKMDVTGYDASAWTVVGVVYNNVFYATTEKFRAAVASPGFVKTGVNEDGDWAHTDRSGSAIPGDESYPAQSVAPAGQRWGVDVKENYVSWLDWTFFIAFSRDTGVRIFDVKYQGERVVYEMGLMEALAIYAGNDPIQSLTAFLDIVAGMGTNSFTLLPGFDCPSYATFLNTTTHDGGVPTVSEGSICIFEQDAGFPVFRHTAQNYTASVKNVFLTVRSISTMGNYDYMLDYHFLLDGSIEISARASGYIIATFFTPNSTSSSYGFKIHENLSGSMHDHVLNYKLDLDILGTKNTVVTSEFVEAKEVYPWSGGKELNTFKLKKSWITNEDQGKIHWGGDNNAKSYSVVNKASPNANGEYRGYKVMPITPPVRVTAQNSEILGNAAKWADANLWVTKRKDTEMTSSHPYASVDVWNPAVEFAEFLNGEDLVQEDLVLWVNIGMHHAPTTGDLPTTMFTSAHGGVRLEPMNYFEESPAKRTSQMVRVNRGDLINAAGVKKVETFGAERGNCSVQLVDVWGALGA